jgi:hypothetical protein
MLYLRWKIYPASLLMQRDALFTMENSFSTLADATIDFLYDANSSITLSDETKDFH